MTQTFFTLIGFHLIQTGITGPHLFDQSISGYAYNLDSTRRALVKTFAANHHQDRNGALLVIKPHWLLLFFSWWRSRTVLGPWMTLFA